MPPPTPRRFHVFTDESGIDHGSPCYTIGALVIPEDRLLGFLDFFAALASKHGVRRELKWSGFNKSHGPINFSIQMFNVLIRHPHARFSAIVVKKDLYEKWRHNKEQAFYTTYSLLLKHRTRVSEGEHMVVMDDKSDRYAKQDEVLQIVTNHMATQIAAQGRLVSVAKGDSKLYVGIQVADILAGAINGAHARWLRRDFVLNRGKVVAIERLAAVAGWDDLCYDTFPMSKFNIWHFPERSWRGTPGTRRVQPGGTVPFVTAADLDAQLSPPDPSAG